MDAHHDFGEVAIAGVYPVGGVAIVLVFAILFLAIHQASLRWPRAPR